MIVLTGATGFLGRYLAAALEARGVAFRCLVRENSRHLPQLRVITKKIQFVDYENFDSICNALRGCETVIHMLGVINASEDVLEHVNVELTRRISDAAKKEKCQKFIHISSVAALMRHGPYGQSKLRGEIIVQDCGVPYTTFRPAYIYGFGDENNTALLIKTLKRWWMIPLLGGGSFKLQPVYIDDVVDLILQAIDRPALNSEFPVAGPTQISLRGMLEILSTHLSVNKIFIPLPLKPVQLLMRLLLLCHPNTQLPAKQILELDKHEAFDISKTCAFFKFLPRSYNDGAASMFRSSS